MRLFAVLIAVLLAGPTAAQEKLTVFAAASLAMRWTRRTRLLGRQAASP
jgi:ABC-type molybdate transport system substrate-binding protein